MFEAMIVDIGDSLSDLACSEDGDDGKDEHDEETEQGELSEYDESGWVMGTIYITVQQRMQSFRQQQTQLVKLTQPGWGDSADCFRDRDRKYSTSELMVPAVIVPQTDDDAAALAPTTFRELIVCLDIVHRISQMLQGTSRPGSSHIRLGFGMPQSDRGIAGLASTTEHDSSSIQKAKPVEPISFDPCI